MKYKIGIPRALFYHYYYPGLKEFFEKMNIEVILSEKTNKSILDKGVKLAVDDLCLPFKAYYGHILQLIDSVDYLFVPRLVSLGKNNSVCPKFMGLPDMLRGALSESNKDLPPLIAPDIDLKKGILSLRTIAHQIGKKLSVSYWKVEYAFWRSLKTHKKFKKIEKRGYTPAESMDILKSGKIKEQQINIDEKRDLKIAVLGHSYLLDDDFLSMGIINHLKEMGVEVITEEMIDEKKLEDAAKLQPKGLFWYFNRKVMGAAYYLLNNIQKKVDGIIQVNAFGCGPDSLINELIGLKGKKHKDISLLNINVDEHSGQAGLITRLEAFVDLLERRKLA